MSQTCASGPTVTLKCRVWTEYAGTSADAGVTACTAKAGRATARARAAIRRTDARGEGRRMLSQRDPCERGYVWHSPARIRSGMDSAALMLNDQLLSVREAAMEYGI